MKLKVLAVSLFAMFALVGTALGAAPLPENHSPSNEATISGTSSTVQTVEFSCPSFATTNPYITVGWFNYSVEFATNPELNPEGAFATPFRVWLSSAQPTNVAEDECKATYPFDAASSGTKIYWRAYRLNCAEGPCHEYGPIWSFTPVPASVPAPAPMPTPPPTAAPVKTTTANPARCRAWQNIAITRFTFAKEAASKFNHAKTHGERNYWHAQLKKRARSLRQAHGNVERFCP